jgi:hypothetical protein
MTQPVNYYKPNAANISTWVLGLIVFVIGVANLFLVHPVPGLVAIGLSVLYLPTVNSFLLKKFGFQIPAWVKIVLAVFVIWFTLGVSDLGDMID